jgi:hypothetical protein
MGSQGQKRVFHFDEECANDFSLRPGRTVRLRLVKFPNDTEFYATSAELLNCPKDSNGLIPSYPLLFSGTLRLEDILKAAAEMDIPPNQAVQMRIATIKEALLDTGNPYPIWSNRIGTEHIQPLQSELKRLELYLNPPPVDTKKVPQEAIDFAKSVLISQVVDFRPHPKMPKKLVTLCPFHQDKDPSFEVSNRKGGKTGHCFPCGADADALKFIHQVHNLNPRDPKDFLEAVKIINRLAGGPLQ